MPVKCLHKYLQLVTSGVRLEMVSLNKHFRPNLIRQYQHAEWNSQSGRMYSEGQVGGCEAPIRWGGREDVMRGSDGSMK